MLIVLILPHLQIKDYYSNAILSNHLFYRSENRYCSTWAFTTGACQSFETTCFSRFFWTVYWIHLQKSIFITIGHDSSKLQRKLWNQPRSLQVKNISKVRIFWEGHKHLKKSPKFLNLISNVKINKHPNRYVVQFFIGSGV